MTGKERSLKLGAKRRLLSVIILKPKLKVNCEAEISSANLPVM